MNCPEWALGLVAERDVYSRCLDIGSEAIAGATLGYLAHLPLFYLFPSSKIHLTPKRL